VNPPGTFVLSLDTELAWGNCWNGQVGRFAHHYDQYRASVRRIVTLLDQYDMPATWAFVGHLFLDACDGQHADVLRPHYPWLHGEWLAWDPGTDLKTAPWWYGRDLLDCVRGARTVHEIATHTFSHLIADDPGCPEAVFRSEIAKCVALQREVGLPPLRSIVYPTNAIAHLGVLPTLGLVAYRGREQGWHYRAPRALARPAALLFRALPFQPPVYDLRPGEPAGLVNVPASMVLLAYDGARRLLPDFSRVWQAARGLRAAATQGRVFHLYFHPYNLASSPRMAAVFEAILQVAARWRAAGRLRVCTMGQLAEEVLAGG
jgi:peptidoglycan/xylan/chitin deacetylase (PgdA/CDA1 family)